MAKKKRRRRVKQSSAPWSIRLGVLITVLVIIVAAAGIMMAPAFDITEVYCEGTSNLKNEDVISAAGIENGKHILMVNIGKARGQIEALPLVKEANVRRVFPNKICITVSERTPSAYIMRGAECLVTDSEGVVIEAINDGRVNAMVKDYTPAPTAKEKNDENKENNQDKVEKKDSDSKTADEDKSSQAEENNDEVTGEDSDEAEEQTEPSDSGTMPYHIPLVAGIEVEEAEQGKPIKAADEGKLEKAIEILNALHNAQLLERTTYLDVTDTSEIRVVVEKRLDIYLGKADNTDYKCKFLAEVINTKIAPYENVVMDYRGDDVFVRRPDDGKDRIVEKEKDKSEKSDEEDKSEDDSESSDEEKSDNKSDDKKKNGEDKSEESDSDVSDENSDEEKEEETESEKKAQSSMSLSE